MSVRAIPLLGIALLTVVLTGACARMGAPRGGPEDRIPPMVVSTEPDTFAVIEPTEDPVKIRFSERISERPVTVSTLEQAVRVSPTTSDVRVKHGRNGLEISLQGGFEAGTVYRISVLPLIQDRFGNPMRDVFEFFFSTGPDFEANVVAGVVTDRLTGSPVESIRVDAVPALDTTAAGDAAPTEEEASSGEEEEAVVVPAYTSVTDSLGIFAIRYLPAARYRLVAFEDQNRNGVANFSERQDEQAVLIVGPADTLMPLYFDLLQPDTTPAHLVRIETLDSLFLRVSLDDYLDPADEFRTVALRFEKAEGFEEVEGEIPLQEWVLQEHLYRAYQDSLNARADSVARGRADSIAAARADSLAAEGIDTTSIDPELADPRPVAPPEIPQEVLAPPAGELEEPGEPLPQQSLVVVLRRPMLPRVVYQVTVLGVVNIAGLGGGGGEAVVVWEPREEEVADTAALPPDTAAARPDTAATRPDTAAAPPDTTTVPPGTTVAPPDTTVVPPDTAVASRGRTHPRSTGLSHLLRLRRRLPLPPRKR